MDMMDIKTNKLLKIKGLSVTKPRKKILSLLMKEHRPLSAEEIFNNLPDNACDQATVYRCLNQFVEAKLVNTTYLEKDMTHFEFNDPNHHQHHIFCKICKKIDLLHDCILDKIEANLMKKGYKEIQHRLEFFGICENCQNIQRHRKIK